MLESVAKIVVALGEIFIWSVIRDSGNPSGVCLHGNLMIFLPKYRAAADDAQER